MSCPALGRWPHSACPFQWVLAFEIFIPLVLFFILLGLRQKKPTISVKEGEGPWGGGAGGPGHSRVGGEGRPSLQHTRMSRVHVTTRASPGSRSSSRCSLSARPPARALALPPGRVGGRGWPRGCEWPRRPVLTVLLCSVPPLPRMVCVLLPGLHAVCKCAAAASRPARAAATGALRGLLVRLEPSPPARLH